MRKFAFVDSVDNFIGVTSITLPHYEIICIRKNEIPANE